MKHEDCPTCTCDIPLPDPARNRKGKHHKPPSGEEEAGADYILPASGAQSLEVLDTVARFDPVLSGGKYIGNNDVKLSSWANIYHQSWLGRIGQLVDDGWVEWGEHKSPTGNGGQGRHRVLTARGRAQYPLLKRPGL